MGRTHLLIGVTSLWLLGAVPGLLAPEALLPMTGLAAVGALLPDLDATDSKIKRLTIIGITPFAPLSVGLNRAFGHRGALHSLLGWGVSTLLFLSLNFWTNGAVPFALSLGYASHLAADACTKSGIPSFYPRRQRYHLLPRPCRLTTGSMAEEVLFVVLAMLMLGLLLHQLSLASQFLLSSSASF